MTIDQITSIIIHKDAETDFVGFLSDYTNQTVQQAFDAYYEQLVIDSYEDDCKVFALMEHTNDDFSTCEKYIKRGNYLVLTDRDAENKWDEYLDNYLDDIILPELPESAQQYFNRDAWISDAKLDGRGHSLSSYDGNEHCETVNGVDYYIYQQ